MISGMDGSEASIRYEVFSVRLAKSRSPMWSTEERIWFCATTMKHRTISVRVGCLGAGWILWRWENEGAIASRDK